MIIQLAMDSMDIEQCAALLPRVKDSLDIAEVGTGVLFRFGTSAVRALKDRFPEVSFLADCKIMDGGERNARNAFESGASYTTVLAVAHDATIRAALEAARACGGEVIVDLINHPHPVERAIELEALGATAVNLHYGGDQQRAGLSHSLALIEQVQRAVTHAKVSVTGGITLQSLREIARVKPDIVVVGKSVTRAADPAAVLKQMYAIAKA